MDFIHDGEASRKENHMRSETEEVRISSVVCRRGPLCHLCDWKLTLFCNGGMDPKEFCRSAGRIPPAVQVGTAIIKRVARTQNIG